VSPRILGAPFITAASILLGCNFPTELPIRYETEHLEIGTEFDDSLFCRGDLLELERRVARTEDELEFTLKETYTVYVWSDESWGSGAAKNCGPGDALGCTRKSRATIWTTRFSLEHELVHAVIGKSRLHPFFEEGLAEVYGGGQTRFGQSAPSANSSTDRASADVQTAAHFLRWLRERWGPHYLALLARTEDGFDDFEAVYGMSINAAEQLYFAEAPYAYAAFDDCDAGDLAAADIADRWVDQIELDCDAGADTLNAGDGIIVHRSLNISEAGYYSVMTDGEWFDIYRCGARFEDVPGPDSWADDVPSSHAGYPSSAYRHYLGAEVHHLFFEVGRHDIGVGILGHGQGVANVAIWPSLAPTPEDSE